jgi:hypothetical protein
MQWLVHRLMRMSSKSLSSSRAFIVHEQWSVVTYFILDAFFIFHLCSSPLWEQ